MKNDFNKYDFYSYMDETNGVNHYFIKINGKMIKVDKEIYYVLYNSYRKQLRDNIRDQINGLISYDVLNEDGFSLLDRLAYSENILSYDEELLHKVIYVINELNDKDREFITELLLKERKEKELARKYNVRQQSINKRKQRIIKKIQKKLKTGC